MIRARSRLEEDFSDSRSIRIVRLLKQIGLLQRQEHRLHEILSSPSPRAAERIEVRVELKSISKSLTKLNEELRKVEAEP